MRYAKHDVSVRDEVTKKTTVVATIDVPAPDTTLEELQAEFTDADIAKNAVRQMTQDLANVARVDYKDGGLKAKRAEEVAGLAQAAAGGDPEALKRLMELALKRR